LSYAIITSLCLHVLAGFKSVIERANEVPTRKFLSPQTEAQEIGWITQPLVSKNSALLVICLALYFSLLLNKTELWLILLFFIMKEQHCFFKRLSCAECSYFSVSLIIN
jgi:hypothetical protein